MKCPNCDSATVNGIVCHEHGCPTPWIGRIFECCFCGEKFRVPEDERPIRSFYRIFCNETCKSMSLGEPLPEEEDDGI
ncbi:MAG: hypothetical protein WC479_10220 [Candidatus Izemoplasmatales bacterium]